MVRQLIIKNVQSHKRTVLRFSPGVNIICGMSQAGKTAMFRAVRLLFQNRPLGLSLKSDLSEKNLVISVKNASNTVTLTKSDKASKYVVEKDGKKTIFRKFKGSIPDLVSSSVPIDFDLSFQDQLRPYSVLESSNGLRKRIDSVIGTEKLESWIDKTSKLIKRKKAIVKNLKVTISESKKKYEKYEGLGELKKEINYCSSLNDKILKLTGKLEYLVTFQSKYLKIKQGIDDLSGVQKSLTIIDEMITDQQTLGRLNEKETILYDYEETVSEGLTLKAQLSTLKTDYGELLIRKKRCPYCFSKIDRNHVEMVLKNTEIKD